MSPVTGTCFDFIFEATCIIFTVVFLTQFDWKWQPINTRWMSKSWRQIRLLNSACIWGVLTFWPCLNKYRKIISHCRIKSVSGSCAEVKSSRTMAVICCSIHLLPTFLLPAINQQCQQYTYLLYRIACEFWWCAQFCEFLSSAQFSAEFRWPTRLVPCVWHLLPCVVAYSTSVVNSHSDVSVTTGQILMDLLRLWCVVMLYSPRGVALLCIN